MSLQVAYWRVGKHTFLTSSEVREFFRIYPNYYYAKGYDYLGNHVVTFTTRQPFSRVFREEYSEYHRESMDRLFNKD